MPYISHHFQGKERPGEEPPWGVQPSENFGKDSNGKQLTTYGWMFQGQKGLPAEPFRNHTTNHFDPQNWRNKSSYKETFQTPQVFSRHIIDQASPARNNRPHPKQLIWPLEPYKGYMIWKPNLIPDEEKLKAYSAPSLLRQYNENKWRTTTQTTYQNYFLNNRNSNAKIEQQLRNSTGMSQRTVGTESHSRMKTRQNSKQQTRQENKAQTTPVHLRTFYKTTFTGEMAKPSTNAKPADHSWRNIKY